MTHFTDAPFMSAQEKHSTLCEWNAFLRSPSRKHFTRRVYSHLVEHCGFIAHFDQDSFYRYYFEAGNKPVLSFFGQFWTGVGYEQGSRSWIDGPGGAYRDLNEAMMEHAKLHRENLSRRFKVRREGEE